MEDSIAPAPVFFRHLVDDEVWVLLRDAAAGDDELFCLAACFGEFGGEVERRCGDGLESVH